MNTFTINKFCYTTLRGHNYSYKNYLDKDVVKTQFFNANKCIYP